MKSMTLSLIGLIVLMAILGCSSSSPPNQPEPLPKKEDFKPDRKKIIQLASWTCSCEGGVESLSYKKESPAAHFTCIGGRKGEFNYNENTVIFDAPCPSGVKKAQSKEVKLD